MAAGKIVRIGGGSAFFDDSLDGHPGLLEAGVDYLVYDYLAEVTMSFLAAETPGNANGYSQNFLTDMRPFIADILDRKIRIVTNWGGLNPDGAADAFRALAKELGRTCKVAVVKGDDLRPRLDELKQRGVREMFSGAALPEDRTVLSANVYLGAFPIAAALAAGADVVITGRVVDSALSLGPLIHEFGWTPQDFDLLSAGTLIGHLMECSLQVMGGTFTDWHEVPDFSTIGNPIAECRADGTAVITMPSDAGGMVTVGTVAEQMIYEVSDPQAYFVPDVVCDFSDVTFEQVGKNRVLIQGARGYPPSADYKVCATYSEGWRAQIYQPIIGPSAANKARKQAQAVFDRVGRILRNRNAKPLNATHLEVIGAESSYGPRANCGEAREVVAMITVDHDDMDGIRVFLKEQVCAMGFSPGVSLGLGGNHGRGATPLMRVFNFLMPRSEFSAVVLVDGKPIDSADPPVQVFAPGMIVRPPEPEMPDDIDSNITVPLISLVWGRSGDKGNLFNVGLIARKPHYFPYVLAAMTSETIGECYAHFVADQQNLTVDRYLFPGASGVNFVVHDSLGGGGSVCARIDPLAKGMAQILLDFPVPVSAAIAAEVTDVRAKQMALA